MGAVTLNCEKCRLTVGEIEKGKIRKGAVVLCSLCWERVRLAVQVADVNTNDVPDFLKGLFGGKHKG